MTSILFIAMALSPSLNPAQPDAAQLQRMLERLEPGARVLYVAAHPDDENTRLLAWLVQVKKARAAYLSITRGDGGQNLIGGELGPALGALRTQELLAARRLDGAEQFFTRARDFGYSKSPEEALRFWGHERILEDVVWVMRTFKPDVVITRFSPKPSDTHGHHTASAQLALEAFDKAADASFAPEQLKSGAQLWKPKRIFWNAGWFQSKPPADLSGFTKEDVGTYDALLGQSMGELAGTSRTMHKSQGFGAARQVGPVKEYFQLLAGEPAPQSIFDGLPDWHPPEKLLAAFKPGAPHETISALVGMLAAARSADKGAIAEAIVACAGLHLEAIAAQATMVPDAPLAVKLGALQRLPGGLSLEAVVLSSKQEQAGPGALGPGLPWQAETKLSSGPPPPASDPAWLRKPPEDGYYPIDDLADRVRPEPQPPLYADFRLRAAGAAFEVRRPILYRWVDPVQGERTRAIELAPPATIDATSTVLLLPNSQPRTLRAVVRASAGPVEGRAIATAPPGFKVEPESRPFKLGAAGSEVELQFQLSPGLQARAGELSLSVEVAGKKWDRGVRRIEYAHVPPQVWHPQSSVRLVPVDLKLAGKRIGYVAGAGDSVAEILAQAGYSVTALGEAALRDSDLSGFDAIVLGIRAYNVNHWLAALQPRLLAYAQADGTVLVQYNTRNWFSEPPAIGPYPFEISRDRVTDETAEVLFELPDHPALRSPNAISPQDFEGWVQERGLYFAEHIDPHYEAPLSMHDPGEQPLRGSLIIAKTGKGRFVYTGLSFFRQLPAGVPGALRLFANLLAQDADARRTQ